MSRLSDERPGTDDTFRLGEDWHSKANCPAYERKSHRKR
jgi:hypothetical protein